MRTFRRVLIASLLLVSCPGRSVLAEGREVTFTMADGRVLEGELLSVRAGSFVISTVQGLQEKELRDHPEYILDLPMQNVKRVTLEGNSYTLPWDRIRRGSADRRGHIKRRPGDRYANVA